MFPFSRIFRLSFLCASVVLWFLSLAVPSFGQAGPDSNTTLAAPVFDFPVQVHLEAHFDPATLHANRDGHLLVTLEWTGRLDEVMFDTPKPPDLDGLALVKSSSSNWKGIVDGQATARRIYDYQVKPLHKGEVHARNIRVEYTDQPTGKKQSLESPDMTLTVTDSLWNPEDYRRLFTWIGGGLGAAAFLGGLVLLIRRKRRPVEREHEEADPEPEDWASLEWETLRKVRLMGDYKEWYAGVSRLLRGFVQKKTGLETGGLLTRDIVQRLQALETDPATVALVEEVLEQCDLMKFAGHKPQSFEMDSLERKARQLWEAPETPAESDKEVERLLKEE